MSNVGLNSSVFLHSNSVQTPTVKPAEKPQADTIKNIEPQLKLNTNDINNFDLRQTKSYNMSLGLEDSASPEKYTVNPGKFNSPTFKDRLSDTVDSVRDRVGDKVFGGVVGAAAIGRVATGGSVSAPLGNGLSLKISGKVSSAPQINKDPYTFYNIPENHGHRGINFTLKKTF